MSFFPNDIFNCVCYIRKSRQDKRRERETGEDTLFEQRQLMSRLLEDAPFPVDTREEVGSGETFEDRPEISRILDECLDGKFNAIAVKELSRIGRSSLGLIEKIRQLFEYKKIYIITPSKVYDPENSGDKQIMDFYFFLAHQELKMIKERMVNARYNYASMGKWMAGSSIPYGYDFHKKTRKLIPNPDQKKIVEKIYDLYVNGEQGLQGIVGILNRSKTPSPKDKKWTQTTVRRILENPVYIGTVIYGKRKYHKNDYGQKSQRKKDQGTLVKRIVKIRDEKDWAIHENSHTPLVDKDIYEKAQDKLENRKREYPVNTDFEPDVLAGIFTCHECGKKMLKNVSNQKYDRRDGSGETSYYRKEFLACIPCSRYVKYRSIEEELLLYLSNLSINPDDINQHIEVFSELKQKRKERTSKDDEIKRLNKEEVRVTKMIQVATDSYNNALAEEKDVLANLQLDAINRYSEQLQTIQEQKKELLNSEEEEEEKVEIPKVQNKIKDLLAFYQDLENRSQKNELFRNIFEYGEVHILEKGRGRKPAVFELKLQPNYDLLFGE